MGKEDKDSERVSAVQLVVGKGKEAEKEKEEEEEEEEEEETEEKKKGEKEKRNYDFFITATSRFYGSELLSQFTIIQLVCREEWFLCANRNINSLCYFCLS